MTGFASLGRELDGQKVTVTAKSVNHRFLDLALRAPQSLAAIEARLRAIVQQRLTRGRVELTVFFEQTADAQREVVLNEPLLERIGQALAAARRRGWSSAPSPRPTCCAFRRCSRSRRAADATGGELAP